MTLKITQQADAIHFTGVLNRDTLMLYSPFTQLNKLSGSVKFDFDTLDNIDTAGLAWLLQQLSEAKRLGITIALCNVPQQLLSLADVTAVRSLLPIND
ncbi:STAS domain-containing protein [Rheinheimera sp. NSM]|uniref:STAS domain-containing protein n=1 Tax=Rheinheimera sp. NSM TaxID=3457884 RepID=UPI0040373903